MTKEERAAEALRRRQEDVEKMRKKMEEERSQRMNFQRDAEDSKRSDRDRDREARRRERERERERERAKEVSLSDEIPTNQSILTLKSCNVCF